MARRLLCAVAIALVATVVLRLRDASEDVRGFTFPDAYHYADIGRQIARGDGVTTLQTYPYVLAWLREAGVGTRPPWPNVTRFPLLPLLYAPVFRVAGVDEAATHRTGAAFWIVAAVATFLLGARLFGDGPGVVAAAFQISSSTPFGFVRAGLPDLPASVAIVAASLGVAVLTGAASDAAGRSGTTCDRARSGAVPLALGLLLGCAFLLRYDLLVLLAAALPVLAIGRQRTGRRQAMLVLLGCMVPVGLWLVHEALTTGVPGVYLGLDRNLLARRGARDVYNSTTYESPWHVLWREPGVLATKLEQLAWPLRSWRALFGWNLAWLGPLSLAVLAWLVRARHPAVRTALFLAIAFVLRTLIFTVTHHEARFHASFAPALLALALGGAWSALAARWPARPRARAVAGALLSGALLAWFAWTQVPLRQVAEAHRFVPPPDATYDAIRTRTPPHVVLASTESESVAWLAERPVVCAAADQIAATERLGVRIDGLLYPSRGAAWVRQALLRQGLADEFVPVSSGPVLTLWLRRALVPAWQERTLASSRPAHAG